MTLRTFVRHSDGIVRRASVNIRGLMRREMRTVVSATVDRTSEASRVAYPADTGGSVGRSDAIAQNVRNCGDSHDEKENLSGPSGRRRAWRLHLGRSRSTARGGIARDPGGQRNKRRGDERRGDGRCAEARRTTARARAAGTVLAQHLRSRRQYFQAGPDAASVIRTQLRLVADGTVGGHAVGRLVAVRQSIL